MPYIEILAPGAADDRKRAAVAAITAGIKTHFDVAPSTVTIYFSPVAAGDYAHAGCLDDSGNTPRVFVKVHAYRRNLAARRAVAIAMTPAIARCFETSMENVAIYFMDRERDEVAHGGCMACDVSHEQTLDYAK